MKWLIRLFFRTLRRVLGPVMLLMEKLTTPEGVQRSENEQQRVDDITRDYELYQFKTCPFCIKVRKEIARNSLNITLRDAQNDPVYRQQLLEGGGKVKVPCLKIKEQDGKDKWIYESNEIIDFLEKKTA
jgi:glutaredoxin